MMNAKSEKQIRVLVSRLTAIVLLLALFGCAGTPERKLVPPGLTSQVGIEGIPDARVWGDERPKFSMERFDTFSDADFRKHFYGVYETTHSYLAISGGGPNGAFGAGLLARWTATGIRPEFTMMTGISTGGLTATFAFLGSDYEDTLKKVYTTTTTKKCM